MGLNPLIIFMHLLNESFSSLFKRSFVSVLFIVGFSRYTPRNERKASLFNRVFNWVISKFCVFLCPLTAGASNTWQNIFSDLQNIFLDLAAILGFCKLVWDLQNNICGFKNFIQICNSFSDLINSSTMISKKHYDLKYFFGFSKYFFGFRKYFGDVPYRLP